MGSSGPGEPRGWKVRALFEGSISDDGVSAALAAIAADDLCPGASDIGVRNLLLTLVLCTRPRRVLEVGGHLGSASVVIAHALRLNRFGELIVLEPGPQYCQKLIHHIRLAELQDWARVIPGGTNDEQVRHILNTMAPFELAFIDGFHSYDQTIQDLELVMNIMEENGLIVLHDSGTDSQRLDPTGKGGTRGAIEAFCRRVAGTSGLLFEFPHWLNPTGTAILCKQPRLGG
jgi:predicted O-methyltransferase YrrM